MAHKLYKEDNQLIPSYQVLDAAASPHAGFSEVSTLALEWKLSAHFTRPLITRAGLMEHVAPNWGSLSDDDKKILIGYDAAPMSTSFPDLNALVPFLERREKTLKLYGFSIVTMIMDVSGLITLPLDWNHNHYHIKVADGQTVTITWDDILGSAGMLMLEQGATGTINLPALANGNTLTLSSVAGKYDIVNFGIMGSMLHLSSPPVKPDTAY